MKCAKMYAKQERKYARNYAKYSIKYTNEQGRNYSKMCVKGSHELVKKTQEMIAARNQAREFATKAENDQAKGKQGT